MFKVFIDGSSGTTGLNIEKRLSASSDLELLHLPEHLRKDPEAKRAIFTQADVVFLCLPDAAALEAAELVPETTAVIDTSTAHRTADGWVYGFPELPGQREKILASKRISNPGCHASGFIALAAPLVKTGLLSPDIELTCFSVTGYSGGGKKMIADYEDELRSPLLDSPMQYGLTQQHKHLPEMQKVCGLTKVPVFCPVVSDYYSGMTVTVPLFASQVQAEAGKAAEAVKEAYKSCYTGSIVHFDDTPQTGVYANSRRGLDDMSITVEGNDDRILLIANFDNLGKGACGAAIQNMNILLGREETEGLVL